MGARDTTVNTSFEGRDDLRRFAALASGVLARRVTMPDALRMAVVMAEHLNRDAYLEAASQLGLIEPPESDGETK
jgi:hypothetical protein